MEAAGEIAAAELIVTADGELHRRSPVAEQVDRGAQPRVDVVQQRNAAARFRPPRRHKEARRKLTFREAVVDAIVAQAQIDREALDLPGILGKYAQLHLLARLH